MQLISRCATVLAVVSLAASCQTTKTAYDDDTPWFQKPVAVQERSDALRDGLAAAKREDWEEANERLKKAAGDYGLVRVWAAYIDPRAFFNLALVQDRMGGHELGAIGNYRAYLALKPNSRNAAAVRERVDTLLATARDNMRQLLKITEQSALEFPADSYERNNGLADVAAAKAFLGDLPGAMAIVRRLPERYVADAYEEIGESLAMAGEFKDAKAAMRKTEKPESPHFSAHVWARIGEMEAEANEIEGAIETAELIGSFAPSVKPGRDTDELLANQASVYVAVIRKLIENEDYQRAKALLSKTRQIVKGRSGKYRFYYHPRFIHQLMHLGEDAEAWRVANAIPADLNKVRNAAFDILGRDLVEVGKLENARRALREVTNPNDREYLIARIEKIERYEERLKEAKTAKERDYIRSILREEEIREPGPLRYKDTVAALTLIKFTPEQVNADDWASFGKGAEFSEGTKDFRKFVRELRGAPEFVLSTAMRGVQNMIKKLREYRQIEAQQRTRRQGSPAG